MSRPLRIEFPDAYYHVMNRGRGRQRVFHDDSYYEAFLSVLSNAAERFQVEVHAYCLMSNHYHLMVKTPNANLARFMRHVGGVYTQHHNQMKGSDGALFRGRYKSIVVDSDEYLLHLSKYIHLNPYTANIVDDLAIYQWSSYPSYIKQASKPDWLKTGEVLSTLTSKRSAHKRYRGYVEDSPLPDEITKFYSKSRLSPVLGSADFFKQIKPYFEEVDREVTRADGLTLRPSMASIVDVVANVFNVDPLTLIRSTRGRGSKNTPRKVAMYLSQQLGAYRLNEIADFFGLNHYGSVASSIAQLKVEIESDKRLRKLIKLVNKRFDP